MDHLISELGGSASTLGRQAVHQVRTNILPRVERELRDNIVPKLERKGKELKERWNKEQYPQIGGVKRRRCRPRPPSNTDIVYLTDRFLVSSKPAPDCSNSSGPTFLDIGRDVSSREAKEAAETVEIRQQNSRHDRTFRQRGNPPRLRRSGTNESIQEDFENQEEHEPSTSSIPEEEGYDRPIDADSTSIQQEEHEATTSSTPEEEGHDPPVDGDSTSEQVGKKEEVAKFSENPQDGGATPSSPEEATTSVAEQAGTTIGEEGVMIIRNLEEGTQSPARNQSISPSLTIATNRSPDADTTIRASEHSSSFHSHLTDLIENHKEVNIHSNTSNLIVNYEEAATPLIKNVPPRVISDLDEGEQSTGEGPPFLPSMSLPPLWSTPTGKAPASKSGSGSDDGDTSVASFATCRMDDDTFDATPEPQQESRPEPPQHSSISEPQQESRPDPAMKLPQHSSISSLPPTPASIINSPGSMVTYLDKVHGRDNYLAVSLAKKKPDDRTLLLFRRQIVAMGLDKTNRNESSSQWSPCCVERSETPSIPHMLKICYALHAFLHLDPNNVVLTYCDNGKTRTAIVAACFLRFSNMVEKTEDGFRHFLSTLRRQRKLLLKREKERRKTMGPLLTAAMDALMEDYYDDEDGGWETNGENLVGEETKKNDKIVDNIIKQIPPSLKLFFEQFDRVLKLGGFLNRKPLLLRAIMLQGVPVEDQPCLDIWDSSQQHVYSSHPPVSTTTVRNNKKPISQWVDEEGFYRINVVLDGEFLVLCRFGGDSAQLTKDRNIHDPSKILFRYTNTTGFMSGGCPYELSSKKVDLMRLYADHLDDEEFLLTLLFEAEWEHIEDHEYDVDTSVSAASWKQLRSTSEACGERIWRFHEEESRDEGWRVIFENHCARPAAVDLDSFLRVHRHPLAHGGADLSLCPDHLITLSLQLSNYDFQRAAALILNYPEFSWWREDEELSLSLPGSTAADEKMIGTGGERRDLPELNLYDGTQKSYREIEGEATQSILDILDSVDLTSNLDPSDQKCLNRWRSDSTRDSSSFIESHGQDRPTSLDDRRLSSDRQKSLSALCLKDTGYLIPSVIYPHRGDIVRSFHIHGTSSSPERRNDTDSALQQLGKRKPSISKPRIPYFSDYKPKLLPPPSDHIPAAKHMFDHRDQEYHVPIYDSQLEAAKEIHSQLRHTGVTLDMLMELQQVSKTWTGFPGADEESNRSVNPDTAQEVIVEETSNMGEQLQSSMNREEKGKKEKAWQDAQKAEAEERRKNREEEKAAEQAKAEEASNAVEDEKEVLLKDDPDYGKYFKMLKLGMTREQVLHAFQRDGKDPKILDLDPNKSLESQRPSIGDDEEDEVPLKDDPEYAKYFKMLKLGMPKDQVLHALKRDGKESKILDLDPNKSLESQLPSDNGGEEVELPLEDDPEYVKYFKMLKLGMPKDQVLHALKRDDKNPNVLDLDPKKSLKSQVKEPKEIEDGVSLKEDPEYSKYFKMIKMGMPKEQVIHAMKRDGKDPKVFDLDPNKSLKSQEQADNGVRLKDDPEYAKYFKMEQVGLPRDAVKNALLRDGKDPGIMDLDPNKSLKAQIGGELDDKDTGIPMKDDPEYVKYLKMEKMGMPKDVVKNALVRDGRNPAIIDFDPNMSVGFQLKKLKSTSSEKPSAKKKKKKKIRRKKIYWNPIDPKKLKKDSLWNIVRDHVEMGKLDYDQKEFEELFTESTEAGAKPKKKGPAKKEAKKSVQAIDAKRSMNGGIVLSRIKTDHQTVAEFVEKMDHTKFDAVELKNLREYLATADERHALDAYMSNGANSEEKKEELFKDLSETEKYMFTLMKVTDAEAKLHTMEFRNGFKDRFADMTSAVRTLNTACDELRTSEKFRKLMAMILTVVNQINTGGEGHLAMGFTLDALLKLNEAKAFDKKTSVLHYVVKLVKKNDESLLYFENDLSHVIPAESVALDTVIGDIKALQNDLKEIIKIVTKDADSIEKSGEIAKLTLAELVEHKTIVQSIGEVPQQINAGRTPMERFSMNAKVACEQALDSINNLQAKYILVLGYFGEDEKMSTGDFFGILRRFMTEWMKATKQVEKIERRKEKEKKREARRAAKAKKAKGSKSSSRTKDETKAMMKSLPHLGSIAGLADGAALNTSKNQEPEELSPKPPVGGMAALAAEAALKMSKNLEPQDFSPKPPVGGIAALAAEAACKASKELETEDVHLKLAGGGIAALAAEAACKASKELETEDVHPKLAGGGIAALAAEAARKASNKQETKDAHSKLAGGGIAALAAEAARKASKEQETKDAHTKLAGGGIAALAAEAARKASKEQETKEAYSKPPVVGIAALAAQAAVKKSCIANESLPAGDIAALAAHAAIKQSKQELSEAQEDRSELSVGVIAELATVDISKKVANKAENYRRTTVGGIDEFAAQAPIKKSEKQEIEGSCSEPFVGEIVSLAAQTMLEISENLEADFRSEPLAGDLSDVQVALEKTPKKTPQIGKPLVSLPEGGTSSLAAQVTLNETPTASPNNKRPKALPTVEKSPEGASQDRKLKHSPSVARSPLTAQVALETTPKLSPQDKTLKYSPTGGSSSLAAQVALEKTSKQSPQDRTPPKHSLTGTRSSLSAHVVLETAPKQSPQDKTLKCSPTGGSSSLTALEKTPKQSPQDRTPKHSPSGIRSSLTAQVLLESTPKQLPTNKAPQPPSIGEMSSLAARVAMGQTKKPSSQGNMPQQSPKDARSSLSLALESSSKPSVQNKSPTRSPTSLMSSLSMLLEKTKQQDASKRKAPSLGSFFDKQSRQEVRSEILRQNHDDTSVALMAENFQKDQQMQGNAWNQGGGIEDYIGWANQAIKASDTDSVRDFETARDIVYDDQSTIATNMDDSTFATNYDDGTIATNMDDSNHAANFDDGTIASNFDDDASIGTAMVSSNDFGYSSEQYDSYIGGTDDPYNYTLATDGTQNPYGDAVINMPLEFTQDQGINNGLSFGEDGFDGPVEYGTNEMMHGIGGYDDGQVDFGHDPGLGGFGISSPNLLGKKTSRNNFSNLSLPGPPLGGGNANANATWGATPKNQPTRKDGDRTRPWSAAPDQAKRAKASSGTSPNDDGVVFRGWGDAPKTPEQPNKKSWFWN